MAGRSFACTNCGRAFTLTVGGAAFVPAALDPAALEPAGVTYASGANVRSNPLAIASLICGCLLCVPLVPGIASIITGAIALRKTRDPAVTGKGMAIAGLVLGILNVLLWGAYLGLIFAVMVPTMGMARQTANQVKCASQLKSLGFAVLLYSNENRGAYPDSLEQLYLTQDITPEIFVCPDSSDTKATGATPEAIAKDLTAGGHLSYVYVGKGMTSRVSPATVIAYEPLTNHGHGSNVLFGDGTVTFIRKAQAEPMIKQIEAGQNPPAAGGDKGGGRAAAAPTTLPTEVEQ